MKSYTAIGLMSGTSLDGVDLAFCRFYRHGEVWQFEILQAETVPYTTLWQQSLDKAKELSALQLAKLHTEYGRLLGGITNDFIRKHHLSPGYIASHGHTVFHQPTGHFTFQIGSGAEIAAVTGKTVVCDFRTTDVALGGEGAPLVPAGDELLFGDYDYCLNLGGFANVSARVNGVRKAWDICPVNIVFNRISRELGQAYDKDGLLARKGKTDPSLLEKLNVLPYYKRSAPKSLGAEWVEKEFFPVVAGNKTVAPVRLSTVVEHAAVQIAGSFDCTSPAKILVTGGGAYNRYLMERIAFYSGENCKFVIPEPKLVEYKEAMIFAFLGLLRLEEQPNCLKSVTGARFNSIGGAVYSGAKSPAGTNPV